MVASNPVYPKRPDESHYRATYDVEQFRREAEDWLKAKCNKENIVVTAGPWRDWDVRLWYNEAEYPGQYHVDLYSPIRFDHRLDEALEYAVNTIKSHQLVEVKK